MFSSSLYAFSFVFYIPSMKKGQGIVRVLVASSPKSLLILVFYGSNFNCCYIRSRSLFGKLTFSCNKTNCHAFSCPFVRYVCMLKGLPCGDVHGTDNRLGPGERSLYGPIFPTSRAILPRVTPPTLLWASFVRC